MAVNHKQHIMNKERLLHLMMAFLFGAFVVSCGAPEGNTGDTDEMIEEEVTDLEVTGDNEFLYSLPSPLQIASIFRRSGLTYKPGLTNDPGLVSNYNTKFIRKLNFGGYAADLAYSALNEQNQACINYVKSLSELSESLWNTNVFSSVDILNRFENNMGNPDSLGYIISDFQMELDTYLEENGMSSNSLVIFSGAWIESMHLALQSMGENPNVMLMSRIIEQKKILMDLISILGQQESDAELDVLIGHMKKILTHFESYDVESVENEDDLAGLTMSGPDMSLLRTDVEEARKFMING